MWSPLFANCAEVALHFATTAKGTGLYMCIFEVISVELKCYFGLNPHVFARVHVSQIYTAQGQ